MIIHPNIPPPTFPPLFLPFHIYSFPLPHLMPQYMMTEKEIGILLCNSIPMKSKSSCTIKTYIFFFSLCLKLHVTTHFASLPGLYFLEQVICSVQLLLWSELWSSSKIITKETILENLINNVTYINIPILILSVQRSTPKKVVILFKMFLSFF